MKMREINIEIPKVTPPTKKIILDNGLMNQPKKIITAKKQESDPHK
jgi:hypothetical protein